MCFLALGKLLSMMIYSIVIWGIFLNLALPHWRLYINESGDGQLQTGLGSCETFGPTYIKFNNTGKEFLASEVCEKWKSERPIADGIVKTLLCLTIILLLVNIFWTTLSFFQCYYEDACFYFLSLISFISTLSLFIALFIFHLNYQHDGNNNTGISPKYIKKHSSYYSVASLIYPMIGSLFINFFAAFLKSTFCEHDE